MIKPIYSKVLFVVAFLALVVALPFANAMALDTPSDPLAPSISDVNQVDTECLSQAEAPMLLAQRGQHRCIRHCSERFEDRMAECRDRPDRDQRRHCRERARERERECLNHCYGEDWFRR